jgi:hypothetical protein
VSARKILEGEAEQYWASDEAARVRAEPWNATAWETSRWHFFRFVGGASDDAALAGWRDVMESRRLGIEGVIGKVAS